MAPPRILFRTAFARRVWQACLLAVASGSLFLASCNSVDSPPPSDAFDQPRRQSADTGTRQELIPGDEIEVFVMEDEKFNGKYVVREGGDVILPKVGRIPVSGNSVKGAESTIRAHLERNQLTKATVIVDRTRAVNTGTGSAVAKVVIYLSGSVNRPGQHEIPAPEGSLGVYESLIIAGGIHRYGDDRKVQILRRKPDGSRQTIVVNVASVKSGKERDVPVRQGDIILVPEKAFVL